MDDISTILDKVTELMVAAEELAASQPSYEAKVEMIHKVIDELCRQIGDFAGRYPGYDGMMVIAQVSKSAGWPMDEALQ
jgi:hypothetical protein